MKTKILIIIMLFSCLFVFSNGEVDFMEVGDSFYGLNSFTAEDEKELYSALFSNAGGLFAFLKTLKVDPYRIGDIKTYLDKVDNSTLLGTSIRDSLILYVSPGINDKYLKILKQYKNNNAGVQKIVHARHNIRNYINTNFNFSSVLQRADFALNVSIILPKTDWKEQAKQDNDRHSYMAGDDNYAGTLFITREEVSDSNMETVLETFSAKYEITLLKAIPEGGMQNLKETDLYKVKPGKIKLIAEKKAVGSMVFDKIYEQITANSDKYQLQTLVNRNRYYIKGKTLYFVGIQSLMAGKHVLADKEDLITQHGLLLDTVLFNK